MDMPDPGGHEPEQLAGGDGPRARWTVVAVVAVLAAGAVALAEATHHDPHRAPQRTAAAHERQPSRPASASARTEPAPPVHVGSVFLEHLPGCTRTDHRHRLAVALGVTNLSANPLLLLGATPVSSDAVLVRPVGVRIGTAGCAKVSVPSPLRLGPADDAVVEMMFRIGTGCPRHALVSASVAFDGGIAGIVHANSSELANIDKLNFVQCA